MSDDNVEIVRWGLEDSVVTGKLAPEVADDFVWDMSTFRDWPDEPLFHEFGALYTIRDGVIRHIQVYSTTLDALEAAGLAA
jgi:isochorismate hydrolase